MIKADGFDEAIIGTGTQFTRNVIIYSYEKCVDILMERDEMSCEEAIEWMEVNVCGAYLGEDTPIFLRDEGFDESEWDDE